MLRSQEKNKKAKVKSRHRKKRLGCLFLASAMMFASWGMAQVASAAEPFVLSSPAFKDGTLMPKKMANNTAGSANCVGENISPPLNWANPPAGTKSFALTMVDPEARGGLGVIQ